MLFGFEFDLVAFGFLFRLLVLLVVVNLLFELRIFLLCLKIGSNDLFRCCSRILL